MGPDGWGPGPTTVPCDTIRAWGAAEPAPLPDITAMAMPAAASAAGSPAKTSLRIAIDNPWQGPRTPLPALVRSARLEQQRCDEHPQATWTWSAAHQRASCPVCGAN